ncbi:NrfD/PsrC family molybdoenzyme membrane anchor subunit [Actinopolyspora sp. H202]|uniref:NrfD/PsrC family molybdoenzyme membrane anchor subunit n=1 Tax=Actinopolyspora sp. H202 TaxID=1500456 RepID=UPI003EE5C55F
MGAGAAEEADGERATFRSYYGRPIIKEPTWKVPDVPAYLYLGGMAGASSVMGALAQLRGYSRLRRVGLLCAAGGSGASVLALIHDLGRPLRFLNMLRVFKPTSPLSVGSWILAPFSALSGAAAVFEFTDLARPLGNAAAWCAALLAPAMTTYTAVLLADTAVPGWHETRRELPFVFAFSSVSAAGSLGTMLSPRAEAGPARRMALLGSIGELVASRVLEHRAGRIAEVYRSGRAGSTLRAARIMATGCAVGAVFARRGTSAAILAGLCGTAASIATRYGVFEAGRESARDPYYTVVPQREARQVEE